MKIGRRLVGGTLAVLLFAGAALCFNCVLNHHIHVAYAEGGDDYPVGFLQSIGWPFKSYEFVEGKLNFLRSPHNGFRLEAISAKKYIEVYDSDQYDTGMTGAEEKWYLRGLCANTTVALALSALACAPFILTRRQIRAP